MTTTTATTYNGWKNYETWNAALWIGNDEGLYRLARMVAKIEPRTPYARFIGEVAILADRTGDGVRWDDGRISRSEMNRMMKEL